MTEATLSELKTALAIVRGQRLALEDTDPNCYLNGNVSYLLFAEANFLNKIATLTVKNSEELRNHEFVNRVRSLYNIDWPLLPELREEDWRDFRHDPPRYLITYADKIQLNAILREVENRQKPYLE